MNTVLDAPPVPTRNRVVASPRTKGLGSEGLASARVDRPDSWAGCFLQLAGLRGLEDDWDGEGAVAPTPELLDSVQALLEALRRSPIPPPAGVGAGPNGSVLLDWHHGRNYFELDVVAPEPARAEWLLSLPGTAPEGGQGFDLRACRALAKVVPFALP